MIIYRVVFIVKDSRGKLIEFINIYPIRPVDNQELLDLFNNIC